LPQPLRKPRPFIFHKLHKRGNGVTDWWGNSG